MEKFLNWILSAKFISGYALAIMIFILFGCAEQPKQPCPVESDNQKVLDTALAAFMISQGHHIKMDCI